jgi:uroporphyrinogen-III synthase
MRVLVTRPQPQADATIAHLTARGIDGIAAPLFTITQKSSAPPDEADIVILTSQHAIPFCSRHAFLLHATALCVGDQTASAAQKAGFTTVISCQGDARDVLAWIQAHDPEKKQTYLRLTGDYDEDTLFQQLTQDHYRITRLETYAVTAHAILPAPVIALIEEKALDGILFFSPRAAQVFSQLVTQAIGPQACRHLTAWCISEATARAANDLAYQKIAFAAAPTERDLLALLAA